MPRREIIPQMAPHANLRRNPLKRNPPTDSASCTCDHGNFFTEIFHNALPLMDQRAISLVYSTADAPAGPTRPRGSMTDVRGYDCIIP